MEALSIKQNEAITQIQATWKGYRTRKFILQTRQEFEEILNEIETELGEKVEEKISWPKPCLCLPYFEKEDNAVENATSNEWSGTNNCDDEKLAPPMNVESASIGLVENLTKIVQTKNVQDGQVDTVLEVESSDKENSFDNQKESISIDIQPHCRQEQRLLTESWLTDKSFDLHSTYIEQNPEQPLDKESLKTQQIDLMLELIWIQQAIQSRKVYLRLKGKSSSS
uniref:IQ domain-containing protein C n=1 Tax=Clytia hemisphaerica TaxID=252671 RepID=A0A7M5X740_9CNID|eukprot:TCONS_00047729-protein